MVGDKSVIVGHRGWQRRSSYKEAVQLPQYRTNRSAYIESPTDSAHRISEPRAGFRLRRLTPTSISSDSFRSLYSCSRSLSSTRFIPPRRALDPARTAERLLYVQHHPLASVYTLLLRLRCSPSKTFLSSTELYSSQVSERHHLGDCKHITASWPSRAPRSPPRARRNRPKARPNLPKRPLILRRNARTEPSGVLSFH